jgi:nuclease domain protein
MKITTMLKWLPVFLSVLGALGYGSRDTELIRSSVQIVSDITDSRHFGLESVGALLTDTIRLKSFKNEQSKTGEHKKAPYTYHGKIIKIHDGDTLHVIDEDGAKHKIRMAYIDAPEINQAYGTRSRDNLIAVADGKKVQVRVFEKDRYKREVAQVSVGATDLNLMQLRDGAAWHYDSYARKQQSKTAYTDYASAQKQAKQKRKGLWGGKSPQAPWDFRREEREIQESGSTESREKWLGIW